MKSPDGRECSEFLEYKKIVLSGKRTTKLYLSNPNQRNVEKIEVDNCAITDGLRCDWLVRLDDATSKEEVFVELKGTGVSHAIQQLRESIEKLSLNKCNYPKRAIVVFTRNPLDGTDMQIFKVKFLKEFKATLILVKDKTELCL